MKSLLVLLLSLAVMTAQAQPQWLGSITQGRFIQEKQLKVLKQPFISSGTFVFSPEENLLRWHTLEPVQSQLLIDSGSVREVDEQGSETLLSREGQGGQILLTLFSADITQWQAHFQVSESQDCLTLIPRAGVLAELFEQFELCRISSNEQQLLMREKAGNQTLIRLIADQVEE